MTFTLHKFKAHTYKFLDQTKNNYKTSIRLHNGQLLKRHWEVFPNSKDTFVTKFETLVTGYNFI